MRQLLNTLFVQTQGSYLRLDHETVKVEVDGKLVLQVPLHHLSGVTVFGNVLLSPFLIHKCAEEGRSIVWLSRTGRFKARAVAPTSGNVLLRRAQHSASVETSTSLAIAKSFVAGKVQNSRKVMLRAARDSASDGHAARLRAAARYCADSLRVLQTLNHLDEVRGVEGDCAKEYFASFPLLIRSKEFSFDGRNRRPPRDPINALLSFLYGLLRSDCTAALEGVGLDPQVGFLHALRPGRPSLALDLMEELRAPVADRVALNVLNLGQLRPDDFVARPGGAFELSDDARKQVVIAYQRKKQEEVPHRILKQKVPVGMVPHIQARLLARHLRGDLDDYVPYIAR